MKKQYLAQVQFKHQVRENKWHNAMSYLNTPKFKRYASTLEEAQEAIAKAIKEFNRGARVEVSYVGGLGISTFVDEKIAEDFQIVKSRIRVREVTEWKEVE